MEYTIEELDGKLNRLISILCSEQKIDVNKFHLQECSLGDKRMIFRGLSNQRKPEPLSAEFIRLQDEILSYERDHKIIVDVSKLQYVKNMAIFLGDITSLRADAIVNAGNSRMQIRQELNFLMAKQNYRPEPNGKAKLTKGYNLPANYIIHTVGPLILDKVSYHDKIDLANCYKSCLAMAVENGFKSIAFCCISTGQFKFPRELASKIAVTTVSQWLKEHNYPINVVFCVYNDFDRKLYEEKFAELSIV